MSTPSVNRQQAAPRRVNPWLNPHVLTIAWRDFARLFFSPIAIVVTLVFVLQNGVRFWMLMELFSQGFPITTEPFWMLFNSIAGLLLLFIIPPLTMKTFAEEKRLGTMETLMTAPVTEPAVVLGKFFSVFAFYVFLWLTTIPYLLILKNYTAFDWGPVVTLYGGMMMLGATFIAMGILASSLTRDQIIALVVTVIAVSLWLTVPQVLTSYEKFAASPVVRQIGQYMSVNHLIGETALGLVSLKSVVFFVSVTVLLLFLAVKVVESRKWAASGAAAVHETTFQRFTKYLGMVAVVLLLVDLAWALLSTLAVEWSWEVFRDVALYGQPWLPITAGVLLVLCVATNLRFFKSLVVAGRSLVFGNVVVQVAALVTALVLANLLGLALDRKWDFTQWSVFSISEQTRSRLQAIDLKSPLTVTVIWVEDPRVDPDGLRYRMVERLIRGYHQEVADPYLSYRIIDPHKQPEAFERVLNRTGM
ncbi:MAG: ABC transporter permease, partial [Planctomycetota bacterium]